MPCSKCGGNVHAAYKCPMLIEPLREGFYEGGGGVHSHEDDYRLSNLIWQTCGFYKFINITTTY